MSALAAGPRRSERNNYLVVAEEAEPALPELRMDLKNSEDGSTTMTSPFLLKLAL